MMIRWLSLLQISKIPKKLKIFILRYRFISRYLLTRLYKSVSIQNVTRKNLDYVGNLGITKASFGSLK